ncbi:MAG TPA: Uma2 family endonuclease [Isosphaeraceae bacterium]|nr:Uma2 family endonuclease [Isosphaeraceae bacterium]
MATGTPLEPIRVTPWGDEPLYEVVNGQRVELPPMGAYPTEVASSLTVTLGAYASQNGLGKVVGEMLFLIDRETGLQRRPDVAFIGPGRWPIRKPAPYTAAWDVVPNLAIEVVSPSDRAQELMDKIQEFFRAGVEVVWVVYPTHRMVHIYESLTQIKVLTLADTLDGGALLPGFQLPLAKLFEEEPADDAPPTA